MDKKSFVKILRKVIREEVGRAVKQALTEQTVNHNQVIEHGMNLAEIAENPMPRRPYAKKKKFAKNSMINDLLNETAATGDFASMMQGPPVSMIDDYPQMGATRTSQMVRPSQPMTGINGETVKPATKELQAVQNALMKDYSGIIKAIDKKNGKMGTR
ncbi:MAG TPA: hypothetical protein DCM40_08620 [Maribacter sp.]|nr:hypothetical protein [Maribacter sp.]